MDTILGHHPSVLFQLASISHTRAYTLVWSFHFYDCHTGDMTRLPEGGVVCLQSQGSVYICILFFKFYFIYLFLYSRFLLVIYFIHTGVYMSIRISQFIPPSPLPALHFPRLVSIHLFSASVSLLLLANKFICTIFLDSTYMH